jgi:predicted Zn-dependent protease
VTLAAACGLWVAIGLAAGQDNAGQNTADKTVNAQSAPDQSAANQSTADKSAPDQSPAGKTAADDADHHVYDVDNTIDNTGKSADEKKADKAAAAQKKAEDKKAAEKARNSKNDTDAIGARHVDQGINFYSLEKEIALGKQLAQEVERQAKIIDDPVVAEYVNRIGQNLVRNSDAKVPFTIKVLDSEEVNAFALPGGFFFVNSGILLEADNEAEMAGVMAHEIAHVAARHGTKQASRGELAQIMMIPLYVTGGWAGYIGRQVASVAIPVGFVRFSQGFEKEADYLGLQYLYKAGYDPNSFVDFFEKIESKEKKKPGTMSKFFSTHPMTEDRIKSAQLEIDKILAAKPEYVVNTSEFNDVKARLEMLHNHRKVDNANTDPSRPTLRRASGANNGSTVDNNPNGTTQSTDSDERPTLKRRDQ